MKKTVPFKLDSFLPFKLNTTADLISRDFAEIYTNKLKLSRSQWRILVMLNEHGQLTAKQVCDLTYMEKVMVSRAVKELVRRKLIKRKLNKNDKRSMFLELTAGGNKAIAQLIPAVKEWQTVTRKKLGVKNYNALVSILDDMKERYDL